MKKFCRLLMKAISPWFLLAPAISSIKPKHLLI
jgi:hypothetical protein